MRPKPTSPRSGDRPSAAPRATTDLSPAQSLGRAKHSFDQLNRELARLSLKQIDQGFRQKIFKGRALFAGAISEQPTVEFGHLNEHHGTNSEAAHDGRQPAHQPIASAQV